MSMYDYDDLVKKLRYCADATTCKYCCWSEECCLTYMKINAANAIEELSMKLHGDEAAIAGMKREIERMVVAGKHGEWKDKREGVSYDWGTCSECDAHVPMSWRWYNFCPNCGADMRAEEGES